jgi:hypothetical protein
MADASWTAGIPWTIAVAGWAVTHWFSELRERRKESRAQIDKVYDSLAKLAGDARAFHMANAFERLKAEDLIIRLRMLERQLSRVGCFEQDDLIPQFIALRRSVTLSNFDVSDFRCQRADSDVLEDIASAVEGIEDEMERQYRFEYPTRFPFVRIRRSPKSGPRNRSK